MENLRTSPQHVKSHYNFGNLLLSQDRLAEAAKAYREAIRLKHDYANAHHNLGVVLVRQGEIEEGIESYRAALRANPNQPRRTFQQERLDELAASVKEKGIIQPLIVREVSGGDYEIVAGERRWRAAQMAQLHDIPVIVRDFDDTEVLEVAIIEL